MTLTEPLVVLVFLVNIGPSLGDQPAPATRRRRAALYAVAGARGRGGRRNTHGVQMLGTLAQQQAAIRKETNAADLLPYKRRAVLALIVITIE